MNWNLDKDSRAVVACDGKGHGAVLWFCGGDLYYEIDDAGVYELGDLGLDDAPVGISVWEGKYVKHTGTCGAMMEYGVCDCGPEPSGVFRPPTEEEWKSIRENQCPWNEDDWLVPVPVK